MWFDDHREGLYGGAAGGGKSVAGLIDSLKYVCVPGYSALLIRQTYPQLIGENGLIDMATRWLAPHIGRGLVDWHSSQKRLRFPSGATVTFGSLQVDKDKLRYQGLAFQYVFFDELTHWPDSRAYRYVGFSRVRRPNPICAACYQPMARTTPDHPWVHQHPDDRAACAHPEVDEATVPAACPTCHYTIADVPLRTRAGSNPGGPGHSWVRTRYNLSNFVGRGQPPELPAGRFFVPATISDNPRLDRRTYEEGLAELDTVERARLMSGDWRITEGGLVFNRLWFTEHEAT
jgi:hypothetical protein